MEAYKRKGSKGKERLLQSFFINRVLKATNERANGQLVYHIMKELLEK